MNGCLSIQNTGFDCCFGHLTVLIAPPLLSAAISLASISCSGHAKCESFFAILSFRNTQMHELAKSPSELMLDSQNQLTGQRPLMVLDINVWLL